MISMTSRAISTRAQSLASFVSMVKMGKGWYSSDLQSSWSAAHYGYADFIPISLWFLYESCLKTVLRPAHQMVWEWTSLSTNAVFHYIYVFTEYQSQRDRFIDWRKMWDQDTWWRLLVVKQNWTKQDVPSFGSVKEQPTQTQNKSTCEQDNETIETAEWYACG